MSETEDKLARELGVVLHINKDGEVFAAADFNNKDPTSALTRAVRKCLELTQELSEQRKTILDEPANTLFGIPMTAVKRLINEKRAEEGDNWWVLERTHVTEQRGGTSAKEWLETPEGKKFVCAHLVNEVCYCFPIDPAALEAYASSRLAEVKVALEGEGVADLAQHARNIVDHYKQVKQQLRNYGQMCSRLTASVHKYELGFGKEKLEILVCGELDRTKQRLAEVTAQLERVNDENRRFQAEVRRLHETVERVKVERDALEGETKEQDVNLQCFKRMNEHLRAENATLRAELAQAKGLLEESWTTLCDVCEFHGDPEYHLDVEATRELMKRIDAAKGSTE